MEKREIIKYGYRWVRFIFLFFALLSVLEIVTTWENILGNLSLLLIWGLFYFIFSQSRRLQYNSQNFYIIRGSNEKAIPFSKIKSIKKSSTKVNGSRYWKLLYEDDLGNEHICRYFLDFAKSFNESVRKVNPDVVIWTHPFFNH